MAQLLKEFNIKKKNLYYKSYIGRKINDFP